MTHPQPHPRIRLSRREFLRAAALTVAGGLLAACASPLDRPSGASPSSGALRALPSPQPPATPTPLPEGPLGQFLALSVLLTGVRDLSPVLGSVYMQSLDASGQFETTVAALLEQAGFASGTPPTTLEELEATGIFDDAAARPLADKITEYWYTGVYDTPEGEQAVATFVDALAWSTLRFTKPATLCGSPGFWSIEPQAYL